MMDWLNFDWLWTWLKDIVDWIVEGFNAVLAFIYSVVTWFLDLILYLVEKGAVLLWNLFCYFFNYVSDQLIFPAYDYFRELFANSSTWDVVSAIQSVIDFLDTANYFFPVAESAVIVGGVCSYWLAVLVVKIVLKLIPTVY
jgi:hypothetical protein